MVGKVVGATARFSDPLPRMHRTLLLISHFAADSYSPLISHLQLISCSPLISHLQLIPCSSLISHLQLTLHARCTSTDRYFRADTPKLVTSYLVQTPCRHPKADSAFGTATCRRPKLDTPQLVRLPCHNSRYAEHLQLHPLDCTSLAADLRLAVVDTHFMQGFCFCCHHG